MACYDTAPYTCTYDSGGAGSLPGGGNPDYSSLATWEAASDNDLSGYTGPVILDCYDSQNHADVISIAGSGGVSASIYREVRSAAGCAVPWAGKVGTGANFIVSSSGSGIVISEQYVRLSNFYFALSGNSSSEHAAIFSSAANDIKIINIVAKCTNTGTGNGYAYNISQGARVLCYNCIAFDSKVVGFYAYSLTSSSIYFVSCTAINSYWGFYCQSNTGVGIVFSCYGANNSAADIKQDYWYSLSGWNATKDETADLGTIAGDNYHNSLDLLTGGELDADYLATVETLYENGAAGARFGRNPYDDISSVRDFDNFFKNDTAGEAISKKDIIGYDRPTPDTADASWNVGASQYYTVAPPAAAFMFKQRQSFFTNLRR